MAKFQPSMGDNLTGVARARERCEAMLAGNAEFAPAPVLDGEALAEVRQQYAIEGEPLGTVPPPASFRQAAKTAVGVIKAGSPTLFVDKLAARLAFERSGVRLYQALLSKVAVYGDGASADIRSGVDSVLRQEFDHFVLLKRVIEEQMGGDATTVTPSADIEATLSSGVMAVLVDPRTDLVQSLEAVMVAELADNESWDQLVELSRAQANDAITTSFERARDQERTHLGIIRMLIERARSSER